MAPSLPTARPAERPYDPPDGPAELREQRPLSRLSYPDGHEGWLATGHALVRAVLADPRFSVRPELQHLPVPGAPGSDRPAPPGLFSGMGAPEHTRYRRLLTGQFTVRRMRRLTEEIEGITADHLDAMEKHGGPVDLVAALAQPIPAQVFCELLGVPHADRARLQRAVLGLFRPASPEEQGAAYAVVHEFIRELVAAKRTEPTDDLLSGLTVSDLTDEELVHIGFVLLGAFALLSHPRRLAALRADPGIAGHAIEELLRYLSIIPFTVRTALEDVELHGERIAAGETVSVSVPAANRDPAQFADPDTLDLLRPAGGHVAFGHGIHQCLGRQLARVELTVVLPALVTRFPGLRLAVPAEDIPMRTDMLIYGVHELPVTWEA
ncbi:cytochrome P450 [Amycolatopsis sp. NPDC051106]|uniref:cytochrome P450 n=1 Tax=unclassified Amycolatopsis TaxID=2618356 RepID=UPI003418ACFD